MADRVITPVDPCLLSVSSSHVPLPALHWQDWLWDKKEGRLYIGFGSWQEVSFGGWGGGGGWSKFYGNKSMTTLKYFFPDLYTSFLAHITCSTVPVQSSTVYSFIKRKIKIPIPTTTFLLVFTERWYLYEYFIRMIALIDCRVWKIEYF